MLLQLIPEFKKQSINGIWKLLTETGHRRHVDCINFQDYSPITADMPVFAFVGQHDVVIVLIDWNQSTEDELAEEQGFNNQLPTYYCSSSNRRSPVWRLSEFICQYKQALADNHVHVPHIWGVLVSNSFFINYNDMLPVWELMGITVYHGMKAMRMPKVYYSVRYHAVALAQYKAFHLWCEDHGYLKRDPYAFEDIDADYDEMEFGIDDDDEDGGDYDMHDEVIDPSDVNNDEIPEGSVLLSQNNKISVDILKPMASPREELEKMVGCQNIKSQINDLLKLTQYNNWMQFHYPQWKQHDVSLHSIFFGRPGTGKTTVCKIYGGLLKEAGVLSKGHVVVCNRATFMGSNWGDEEKAIRQVLELAKGGVLMIDEAYLLNSNHPNDPGKLVIPQFMDILSNEDQRDVAIVLCGYKDPMLKLLDLNPGLASRFPNRFEFEDFSIDELMDITFRRIGEYGYHFTRAGLQKYKSLLAEAYAVRNPQTWGNARFVANLLEHIYLLHAKRCIRQRRLSTAFSITPSDIQAIDVPKEKPRIGF